MAISTNSRRPFSPAFFLPLAYFLLLLPWLGKNRLLGLDESTYAGIVLGEIREHHWLPLYFEGHPFWDKPPLLLWLQGLMSTLFGTNEFSLRLLSAVAAALCLHFVFRLGARFGKSQWAGAFCALLLGTQAHFILYSRIANLDMPLIACLLGAWWQIALALDNKRKHHLLYAGCWTAMAVGIKSWFGFILLPAMIWVLFWGKKPAIPIRQVLFRSVLPPTMVMVLWLTYCGNEFGRPYWDWAWGYDLVGRFSGGSLLSPSHLQPHLEFYGVLVQEGLAFLWPLLPLGLLLWWREAFGGSKNGNGAEKIGLFFFFYYLLFLLMGIATLINYLLPLVLVAALGIAFIWRFRGEGKVALAGSLAALLAFLNGQTHSQYLGLVLTGSFVVCVILFVPWRIQVKQGWVSLLLAGLVLISAWKVHNYWRNPPDPNRVWVLAIQAHPARYSGEPLLFLGEHTDARVLEFYSDYQIIPVDRLPPKRPTQAVLFQDKHEVIFLPALEKGPSVGKKPLQK